MKKISFIILLLLCTLKIFASHIVGGEVFYTYLGPGSSANTSKYMVSLRLFRDCDVLCGGNTNVACLPTVAPVGIFTNISPYTHVTDLNLPLDNSKTLTLTSYPPCISNRPPVCYEVKTYMATVELPDNNEGYVIAYQNCCRAASENVLSNANTISNVPGATYDCTIPGKNILPTGNNSSAVFNLKDTSLVCYNSRFKLDFSAVDPDGDSLSYVFASAYDGGDFTSALDAPSGPPPFGTISYNGNGGFSGALPLGSNVTINPQTGLISGVAPGDTGRYVVNVIVYEWRNGIQIAKHRKDFIMRVEQCNIPQPELKPSYITCDGFNLSFKNESNGININSYYWDFGDLKNTADTSISPTPTYTFTDSGTYEVTLITNKGQQCSDTATTIAKVYPGFIPDFKISGSCVINPYQFIDLTTSKYGIVDSWHWDFGDVNVTSDTSLLQNPFYQYSTVQTSDARLIVTNSKGCIDTITKSLIISDKPTVLLPFTDTLICIKDTLQLQAGSLSGTGSFSWSPAININNTAIPDPLVYPNSTTTYAVTLTDNGCVNTESVVVNVIPFVTLSLGADTTICLTDSVQLFPTTNALYFSWSPSGSGISDTTLKNPFARPLSNTQYKLLASVGNCSASDNIRITVVPYPAVTSSPDTSICFGKTVGLVATTTAANFAWSPVNSLQRANTLTPTAGPQATTSYVITVTDNLGCPKPSSDTTVVTVIPPVLAFAGRDTTIVANQPLQLNASGGTIYAWSPTTGMDNPNISNPIVILGTQYDTLLYHVQVSTPEGCTAGDDIKVIVFKTQPDIFVASAFTPNGDRLNDILRPKVVGMKQFNYFTIFNRWGQMLYSTSQIGQGWDGTVSGQPQASGVYVYIVQAIDYTGKVINKKGTVVLIR